MTYCQSSEKPKSKVDCSNGYWQVPLGSEASLLTTFATPFGRYKWNRMPFGISSTGEIFQKQLDQIIEDLDGIKTAKELQQGSKRSATTSGR